MWLGELNTLFINSYTQCSALITHFPFNSMHIIHLSYHSRFLVHPKTQFNPICCLHSLRGKRVGQHRTCLRWSKTQLELELGFSSQRTLGANASQVKSNWEALQRLVGNKRRARQQPETGSKHFKWIWTLCLVCCLLFGLCVCVWVCL